MTNNKLDQQISELKKDLDYAMENNLSVIALSCVKNLEPLLLKKCDRCNLMSRTISAVIAVGM